jgi:hypothetical protein
MFDDVNLITLPEAERRLEFALSDLADSEFIGQLPLSALDYERLLAGVKKTLRGDAERLKEIPERLFLVLMIFCARYQDTSSGFWSHFLEGFGLPNNSEMEDACRERFTAARKLVSHLYFPTEGYRYVSKILYHAIIPQCCVPEMASLIRKLDQDAGWDIVAEMELVQLQRQLAEAVVRVNATRPLSRFVGKPESRGQAAKIVQDLCEVAYLHQCGVFDKEEIRRLLEDNPVQRELWEGLMRSQGVIGQSGELRSLLTPPRWQWDVRTRQLRLYLPRQRLASSGRPVALIVKKKSYSVQAFPKKNRWDIEPLCLSELPLDWRSAAPFRVEITDENGNCPHPWSVDMPESGVLFFKPNATLTLGGYAPSDTGLTAGEWLVLCRRTLRLRDADGDVKPIQLLFPPQGFEDHNAMLARLRPPVEVLNEHTEIVHKVRAAVEETRCIRLLGKILEEADDPEGVPAFNGAAPELEIGAERFEEIRKLDVQWRVLSGGDETRAGLSSIQGLVSAGIAEWSSERNALRFELAKILPDQAVGRFRLKLLQGLQSARYAPVEFLVIPETIISPTAGEFRERLYTSENPPTIRVRSREASNLTSVTGKIDSARVGAYQIEFPHCATEFTATIQLAHLAVPLRWRPYVLRAGIAQTGEVVKWTLNAPVFEEDALSVHHTLHIEAIPDANYEIIANDIASRRGSFGFDGRLEFSLAECKEIVRDLPADDVSLRVNIDFNDTRYELAILEILTSRGAERRGDKGEVVGGLRIGQRIVHSDYGEGILEAFALKLVHGWTGDTARFRFSRYEGVQIFIPTSRRIPVFWNMRSDVGQTRSAVVSRSRAKLHT